MPSSALLLFYHCCAVPTNGLILLPLPLPLQRCCCCSCHFSYAPFSLWRLRIGFYNIADFCIKANVASYLFTTFAKVYFKSITVALAASWRCGKLFAKNFLCFSYLVSKESAFLLWANLKKMFNWKWIPKLNSWKLKIILEICGAQRFLYLL